MDEALFSVALLLTSPLVIVLTGNLISRHLEGRENMGNELILAAGETAPALFDAIQTRLDAEAPLIIGGLTAIAVVAFGIKFLWVAWRGAGKAIGKTGS